MINRRILITGIALAISCIILATTAIIYVDKDRQRKSQELQEELSNVSQNAQQILEASIVEILYEAGSQLIGMHSEGLPFQLSRWQKNNPLISSTFIWTPEDGFNQELTIPNQLSPDTFTEPSKAENSINVIYGDSTSFSWNSGYFLENLENARYSGVSPEPLARWLPLDTAQGLEWIGWHRLYGQGTVRGFTLSGISLVAKLQELARSVTPKHIKSVIQPIRDEALNSPPPNFHYSQIKPLPGYYLIIIYESEYTSTFTLPLFSQILIVLSLILALVSCGFIIYLSNRKHKEALQKTSFVALVSHELKTPLTSISMHAELVDNPKLSAQKQHKFANTILRQSERLQSMIDNLLLLSSLENKRSVRETKKIDLIPILQEIETEFKPTLEENEILLEIEGAKDIFWVNGNSESVRRVFINLIDNAKKYASDGKHITISLNSESSSPTVIVSDQGPGIPASKTETIFTPFSQLDSQLADKSPGIGIGLNISRNLMREIGGDLQLDKSYQNGASFILTFKS
ncbi:HAMP domain-containing histidine kinase [Puniceicoccaceae bacterium K14]|nr:HAMP domain-containing histidine kinase [Puniceicoccaceae bacterium K14]